MIRNVDDILAKEFTHEELDQLDDYLERMIDGDPRSRRTHHARPLTFEPWPMASVSGTPRSTCSS